jgi:DNA polymerase III sliding clamp (beta) subunit (PCNA family)
MESYQVSRSDLLRFLQMAKPSADERLSNVLIGARDGRLVVQFTDRCVSLSQKLGPWGYASRPASMLPFKDLLGMVRATTAETLTLRWDQERFYMDADSMRQACYAKREDGIDLRTDDVSIEMVAFPSGPILDGMPAVLSIIQRDSARNYGSVGQITAKDGDFSLVGTDGFRLAFSRYGMLPEHAGRFDGLTLPYVVCEALLLAAKSKQNLWLGISEDRTVLACRIGTDGVAHFRTSAVKYPNYAGVIPKPKGMRSWGFDVKALRDAAKLAVKTTDKSRRVELASNAFGQLALRSRKEEGDPLSVHVVGAPGSFEMREGDCIHLNGGFLYEALASTKEKTGTLAIKREDFEEEPLSLTLGPVTFVLVPIKWNPAEAKKEADEAKKKAANA